MSVSGDAKPVETYPKRLSAVIAIKGGSSPVFTQEGLNIKARNAT